MQVGPGNAQLNAGRVARAAFLVVGEPDRRLLNTLAVGQRNETGFDQELERGGAARIARLDGEFHSAKVAAFACFE